MKKSIYITISFIILTVIGTLTHEIGHILPAKILGYKTTLHFGSMNWESQSLKYSNQLFREYVEIEKVPESKMNKLNRLKLKEGNDKLWITLGGPIQTMLTGLLGIIILCYRRRTLKNIPFGLLNWIGVFLTLFWSRQIFNAFSGILNFLLGYSKSPFGGDEAKIAKLLNLPLWTIGISTCIVAIIICTLVVLKVIPKQDQTKFIYMGLLGSTIGYISWFQIFGPIILP